jgi:hypothetical protein
MASTSDAEKGAEDTEADTHGALPCILTGTTPMFPRRKTKSMRWYACLWASPVCSSLLSRRPGLALGGPSLDV